ncbi:MAG: GNAT family N-acetyltransferase [Solirubrobacterales bacterium]
MLEVERSVAEQVVELDGMTALLDPSLPDHWDASYLIVERPGIAVEAVLAAADEAIGGAGLRHRTIAVFDGDDGERLAPGLEARGFKIERGVYMIDRGEPDRPASAEIEVEEVGLDDLAVTRREFHRIGLAEEMGEQWVTEDVLDQFIARDAKFGEAFGDRWFVARENGEVASFCRLLAAEGLGQVEDVGTLPAARNRGLARAVMLAAVEASRAQDDEITFLCALADDWPRKLYARLGFEPFGREVCFYRDPED